MTRSVDSSVQTALAAGKLRKRDFLWIIARDRTTNADVPDGIWSDDYDITADVIDPDTGGTQSRSFVGAGALVTVSDVPLVSNLTVQTVSIVMSQVSDHVATLVRLYECKQARVQLFVGLFDPATNTMVGPAECRFIGFVDQLTITTPTEQQDGSVQFDCVSHTQEMTRSSSETRTAAFQKLRNAGDTFFDNADVVGQWQQSWGKADGLISQHTPSFAHIPFA